MALIQGIDGGALLAAFRQGRGDRAADDKTKAAAEEAKQWKGLMAQAMGGQPSGGGVAGNFAPSQPQAPPVAPGATFGEAFSPQAMGAIQSGVPAAPVASISAPPQGMSQPDPNILRKMAVLRPEQAGQIITALKNLNEGDLKQQQAKNDLMGAAAHYVQQGKSPQERLDRFQHAAPQLLAMGWTQGQLQQAASDLSDTALQGFQGMAVDYDKMIDNELAERKFQAGDNVAVVPGGNVANIKPDGSAHYVIGGGGAPTAAPVQVQSIEQAQKLPPGTRFIDPNGVERVVPGGGAGNGVGGFRPVNNGASVIKELFPAARITDNRRPADSALGRANPSSWHVRSGGAVDVAPIPGMTFEQYVGKVKSAGYNIIEAIDEVKHPSSHATGPHWHIVIGEG